jgi:hypothetical protein
MRAASAGALALFLVSAPAAAQSTPPPPGLDPVYPPGVSPGSPRPPEAPSSRPVAPGSVAYPPPGYEVPKYGALSAAPPPALPRSAPAPYAAYYPHVEADTLPLTLPYQDGDTLPRGYKIASRANRSYVVSGAVTFSAAWLSSLIAAGVEVASSGKGFAPLFVPVVGPYVAVGTTASTGAGTVWLVLDGLAQTAGVVLFAYGVAADEKYLERATSARATPLDVLAHPQVGINGSGLTLRWKM